MCGYVRLCAAMCGYVRLCAVMCGYVRLCAVVCGCVRLCAGGVAAAGSDIINIIDIMNPSCSPIPLRSAECAFLENCAS